MAMTIGQVASGAGVNIQTIRYYERRGLLPPPPRTATGYRTYDAHAVDRLRFIKRAKKLGFALDEIAELLAVRGLGERACVVAAAKVREKIDLVGCKIAELERLRHALNELAEACGRELESRCPIIDALNGAP